MTNGGQTMPRQSRQRILDRSTFNLLRLNSTILAKRYYDLLSRTIRIYIKPIAIINQHTNLMRQNRRILSKQMIRLPANARRPNRLLIRRLHTRDHRIKNQLTSAISARHITSTSTNYISPTLISAINIMNRHRLTVRTANLVRRLLNLNQIRITQFATSTNLMTIRSQKSPTNNKLAHTIRRIISSLLTISNRQSNLTGLKIIRLLLMSQRTSDLSSSDHLLRGSIARRTLMLPTNRAKIKGNIRRIRIANLRINPYHIGVLMSLRLSAKSTQLNITQMIQPHLRLSKSLKILTLRLRQAIAR